MKLLLTTIIAFLIVLGSNAQSLVVLKSTYDSSFVHDASPGKIACLVIGDSINNPFQQQLLKYAPIDMFSVQKKPSEDEILNLLEKIKHHSFLIIGLHGTNNDSVKSFGVTNETAISLSEITLKFKGKTIFTLFGNPYILNKINGRKFDGLIVAHQDSSLTQIAAANLIMGADNPSGKLPVSVLNYKEGEGIIWKQRTRMIEVKPEELDIKMEYLKKIDSIALDGITQGAYPGCQIIAAKDGKIFYNKSFGYHTYDSTITVKNEDLYDIASVTKVAATTLSLMRLQSEGLINLDSTLHTYLPKLTDSTPYAKLTLKEMLAHQAGLVSWIPFYNKTLENGKPASWLYRSEPEQAYNIQVADNLFIHEAYKDTIFQRILGTSLRKKTYKYSDLGYYFMKEIIETTTGMNLEEYVSKTFYEPLGLRNISYLPRKKYPLESIIPTEDDKIFRGQLIHGYVHDPGAAMLGGVGGHAGVFASAENLAVLMQLFLNNGSYGGIEYISPEVVQKYTKKQFENNRRGAGFDKPLSTLDGGPTCDKVSLSSFGHSGFTGTIVWADPEHGINYVFLSNRVYPDAENWKLNKMDIRTNIQSAIYQSLGL